MAHYLAWTEAWLTTEPSDMPAVDCLAFVWEAARWLQDPYSPANERNERLLEIVACFKTAKNARLMLLGGTVPPSCDEVDVLSENYDSRVWCDCSGLFPVPGNFDSAGLGSCGCKAIEHMIAEGEMVSSKEAEWNSSELFSAEGLSSAMTELALCHADTQTPPLPCHGPQNGPAWPEVRAPDRKPTPDNDLDERTYMSLFPTHERIRLSADAKHFFAITAGGCMVDSSIQAAIADSGNDILIGDYCPAATEECLVGLRRIGGAAFSFLKLCVYANLMTDWQFNLLVAQIIHFRIISYWRDHALPRSPRGVYGSRMTGLTVHRHIDLGTTVGIVSASLASARTLTVQEYAALAYPTTLINDLVDFRGDTWRNQRENVVLRGVRGNLCEYLDGLLSECIFGAAALIRRGGICEMNVLAFCNWMLLSSGHKVYELIAGTRPVEASPPCHYNSSDNGAYRDLLDALEPYVPLQETGPEVTMKRKELQLLYAEHRLSPVSHARWTAAVTRIVLHPDVLRRLVDVVHYEWSGDLGHVDYCA